MGLATPSKDGELGDGSTVEAFGLSVRGFFELCLNRWWWASSRSTINVRGRSREKALWRLCGVRLCEFEISPPTKL
jgi:hypothetical protein